MGMKKHETQKQRVAVTSSGLGSAAVGESRHLPAVQHCTVNGGLQPQFPHEFKQRELYLLGLWGGLPEQTHVWHTQAGATLFTWLWWCFSVGLGLWS